MLGTCRLTVITDSNVCNISSDFVIDVLVGATGAPD